MRANRRLWANRFLIAFLLGPWSLGAATWPILTNTIHLAGPSPEWSVFEGRKTHGPELRLKFNSTRNPREHTLFIRQDDVKQDWTVALNGQKLGSLFLMEADLIHTLPIPANLLRDGENELRIATRTPEDILIHSLAMADDAKANVLADGALSVRVENHLAAGLPARITIVDTNGSLAALHVSNTNLAVRPGVIYTPDGVATVNLLPGKYTIYATRGPEYSLARAEVTVDFDPERVRLVLTKEVKTAGWIACDPHIHTLSLSKHGDALLRERMITLAAEGIELPIATEHNLHADYAPAAKSLGLEKYFTVVSGNEVTTKRGHFNVFPVSLSAPPANHTLENWPDLIENIRGDAANVVILNHPTDTHSGFTPFAATNFNPITGKNLRGDFDFAFDAMEVINSGAMRTDWMEPFRAWFALLNRGYKIAGVGASDAHDVSRFIVGQGRTYLEGDDSDPSRIDIQKARDALKQGRAVASLGLFAQLKISDVPHPASAPAAAAKLVLPESSGPGDLHLAKSDFLEFNGAVDFPAWMHPAGRTETILYANGRPVLNFPFNMTKKPGEPLGYKMRLPRPKSDTWYVLIAHTPGVTNSYWSISRPYQPSSPEWHPAMIGATNPVWLDADGDGRFTPPRLRAKTLFDAARDPRQLLASLADYDWATAIHAAELLHESGADLRTGKISEELKSSAPKVQQAFTDYIHTIPIP